jgi:hypothetical protein
MKAMASLMIFFIALIAFALIILVLYDMSGYGTELENSCNTDSDCACGVHIDTGECFYGNKDFVDMSRQCPDFCNGIAANLAIVCSNSTCTQKRVI